MQRAGIQRRHRDVRRPLEFVPPFLGGTEPWSPRFYRADYYTVDRWGRRFHETDPLRASRRHELLASPESGRGRCLAGRACLNKQHKVYCIRVYVKYNLISTRQWEGGDVYERICIESRNHGHVLRIIFGNLATSHKLHKYVSIIDSSITRMTFLPPRLENVLVCFLARDFS
jgi:hypothetical protein